MYAAAQLRDEPLLTVISALLLLCWQQCSCLALKSTAVVLVVARVEPYGSRKISARPLADRGTPSFFLGGGLIDSTARGTSAKQTTVLVLPPLENNEVPPKPQPRCASTGTLANGAFVDLLPSWTPGDSTQILSLTTCGSVYSREPVMGSSDVPSSFHKRSKATSTHGAGGKKRKRVSEQASAVVESGWGAQRGRKHDSQGVHQACVHARRGILSLTRGAANGHGQASPYTECVALPK